MTIEYHPAWEGDLVSAARYYEEHSGRQLRDDFLEEVRSTIGRIKSNPLSFAFVAPPVRRARLTRFWRYAIRYRIIEESQKLRILGIVHGSRHPELGKDRS